MANLLLGGVYNHFLTSYASKDVTQSDTHKKDELRDIYKSIVKMNQDAPLYLLPKDGSAEESAISLKEEARQLSGTLSSLQGKGDDALSGQLTAYSSDEDVLSAVYIGSDDDAPAAVSMHVDSKQAITTSMRGSATRATNFSLPSVPAKRTGMYRNVSPV